MRLATICAAFLCACCFVPAVQGATVGPIDFSGDLSYSFGDQGVFPGNFATGAHVRIHFVCDNGATDLDPNPSVGFFMLSHAGDSFTATLTDAVGTDYPFVASAPFTTIYYNNGGIYLAALESGIFAAYSGNFEFVLALSDPSHSILTSDRLSDLQLASQWDQLSFTLSDNSGASGVGGVVTVDGLVPVRGTSWGAIKALYR